MKPDQTELLRRWRENQLKPLEVAEEFERFLEEESKEIDQLLESLAVPQTASPLSYWPKG